MMKKSRFLCEIHIEGGFYLMNVKRNVAFNHKISKALAHKQRMRASRLPSGSGQQ